MKDIIAICRCVKVDRDNHLFEFHFKGVFSGHRIRKIIGRYRGGVEISLGEDYLLYIGGPKVTKSILVGNIWRIKNMLY